ncbi:MAG: Hsp20/alpha crystallin family protein [Desulfobacteraceae bacterium]
MMDLVPWKAFNEIGRLRRDMDDVWRGFFGTPMTESMESVWIPSIDVSETDENLLVKAELPGLEAEDIDIDVSGNVLTIKGEKRTEEEKEEENFYSRERYFGSFQRAIQLPADVNTEKVDATFRNGVLNITLPKEESSRRKRIEVKTQ